MMTTRPTATLADLSPRHQEVALLTARGLMAREIAAALYINVATVNNHLQMIYRITGCRDRLALALWVWRQLCPPLAAVIASVEQREFGIDTRRRRRVYTPEEDRLLLTMRAEGRTWSEIVAALRRPIGSVMGRYRRLCEREEQAA